MSKLPIPRMADGTIDVFKLKMRDPVRVDYSAYAATATELAEAVRAVVDIQRQDARAGHDGGGSMTDFGTFGDNLGRFKQEASPLPSRATKNLPPSEVGKMARRIMGTTETTLDEIVASVAPSLNDEQETVAGVAA